MDYNLTNVVGGLATGISQDSSLNIRPYDTLIVSPESNATSASVPASTITQQTNVISWVPNTNGGPMYVQYVAPLTWALTFPGTTTYLGFPVCVFDCLRNATLTFSAATTVATTVTIDGWDDNGTEVVWTSSSQPAGTTAVVSNKCFQIIKSVSFTTPPWTVNATTNTVLVRGGTLIGLPNFINTATSVISAVWAGATALTAVVPGAIWRKTSITPPIVAGTSIPSATTSDARGYVDITGLTSAPNGSLILQVVYYVYGLDSKLNDQLKVVNSTSTTGIYNTNNQPGSAKIIAQTQNAASGNAMLTTLVKQDRYGAQFPGDSAFMDYYNGLYSKV